MSFDADLPLTGHIKKTHIEKGSQNLNPFVGFGPKEDVEDDDVTGLVEVVEPVRREKVRRRRSTSESDSASADEVSYQESIMRGIAKTKRKRQRLESERDKKQAAPKARQDSSELERELVGPDTFFFVCSLCGKKDLDQFNIYMHLDTEHRLGEEEAVLSQKTFRPRAVLACR